MRLFLAIVLTDALRGDIQRWAQSLARAIPDPDRCLRWVKEDQFHITLKFLGETPEARIPALREAVKEAAKDHENFSLSLGGVGHFGGRVVWLGLSQGTDRVAGLGQSIERHCEARAFARETRHFNPHITLARSKINPGTIRLAELPPALTQKTFGEAAVTHIALIRSTLTPSGSIYEILDRFLLCQL